MEERQNFYRNKIMLAPMVRVGTMPMRLLAVRYGADIVYCEEIIDFKILKAKKVQNDALGTVDFVLSDGTIVFRTLPEEKNKLIFQLGTADAKRALKVGQKIQDYVAGIDVNMGCPKEFSIKGGMGAALLKNPDIAKEILTTLVNGLSIPVTCKIRILPKLEDTLDLVQMLVSTGISAIGVHGRTKEERPQHANHNDVIKAIAESVNIPVIANGGSKEIKSFSDIEVFKQVTGCSSVMIARAAEWNPSIFRKEGKLPLLDVVREYIKLAIDWDNNWCNTKYCVLQLMHADMLEYPEGPQTLDAMTMEDISKIWGLHDYYLSATQRLTERQRQLKQMDKEHISVTQKEDGYFRICMPLRYEKKDFPNLISPKLRLYEWLKKHEYCKPVYQTVERKEDRYFNSTLVLNNNEFTTSMWEKSKQLAEQASASVATTVLDIEDGRRSDVSEQLQECTTQWREINFDKYKISLNNDKQISPVATSVNNSNCHPNNEHVKRKVDNLSGDHLLEGQNSKKYCKSASVS